MALSLVLAWPESGRLLPALDKSCSGTGWFFPRPYMIYKAGAERGLAMPWSGLALTWNKRFLVLVLDMTRPGSGGRGVGLGLSLILTD